MAWRKYFRRMVLAGILREWKVQVLRQLEMERRRESQERLRVVESERGRPRYLFGKV
jgi:hypothetical protein